MLIIYYDAWNIDAIDSRHRGLAVLGTCVGGSVTALLHGFWWWCGLGKLKAVVWRATTRQRMVKSARLPTTARAIQLYRAKQIVYCAGNLKGRNNLLNLTADKY